VRKDVREGQVKGKKGGARSTVLPRRGEGSDILVLEFVLIVVFI